MMGDTAGNVTEHKVRYMGLKEFALTILTYLLED